MKKHLLSLLLLLICLGHSAKAQQYSPRLIGVMNRYWNQTYWSMPDSLAIGYNSAGQDSVEVRYYGDDPFTGVWAASTKCLTTYNGNGSVQQKLYLSIDTTAAWDTTSRATYTYNGSNQVTLVLSENYMHGAAWQPWYQTITTYDANGNKTSETNQSMNAGTGTWNNSNDQKHTYIYDSNSFLIQKTTQLWSSASSGYVNLDSYLYTNDAAGHPTYTLSQYWDGVSSWYDMDKDSSIYDAGGQLIQNYHRYRHGGGMNQWGMQYRESYTYSASGKVSTFLSEPWDPASQAFTVKGGGQTSSFYNAAGDIIKAVSANWDTTQNAYQPMMESYFYYSSFSITSIGKAVRTSKAINAWPNPFSSRLTLDASLEPTASTLIQLFDIAGNEVTAKVSIEKNSDSLSINTVNLPAGAYILKAVSGNALYIKKLIKVE